MLHSSFPGVLAVKRGLMCFYSLSPPVQAKRPEPSSMAVRP